MKCKDKPGFIGFEDSQDFYESALRFAPVMKVCNFRPMEMVQLFFILLTAASLLFLIIGLFRPWAMLWWEDVQTRRKVIKVYGLTTLLCYAAYWVVKVFF